MKGCYSYIFREDDEEPAPTLPGAAVLNIESILALLSQKELVLMPFIHRWHAGLLFYMALPLSELFANPLPTAVEPTDWRLAIIFPIHKKGGPKGVSNYRPVSLTSIRCKIFEKILNRPFFTLFVKHG